MLQAQPQASLLPNIQSSGVSGAALPHIPHHTISSSGALSPEAIIAEAHQQLVEIVNASSRRSADKFLLATQTKQQLPPEQVTLDKKIEEIFLDIDHLQQRHAELMQKRMLRDLSSSQRGDIGLMWRHSGTSNSADFGAFLLQDLEILKEILDIQQTYDSLYELLAAEIYRSPISGLHEIQSPSSQQEGVGDIRGTALRNAANAFEFSDALFNFSGGTSTSLAGDARIDEFRPLSFSDGQYGLPDWHVI